MPIICIFRPGIIGASQGGNPLYITCLDKIEMTVPQMEGAKAVLKQIPLSKKDGTPAFSFRVFTIKLEGHTPYHRHPFEHMNYAIDGHGVIVSENGEREFKKGDFALILPGEIHQFKNTSKDESLVIICAVPKEYE
jgi:quercetin dioxygenase-like cupin family protein